MLTKKETVGSNECDVEINMPRGPKEKPRPCPLCFLNSGFVNVNFGKILSPQNPNMRSLLSIQQQNQHQQQKQQQVSSSDLTTYQLNSSDLRVANVQATVDIGNHKAAAGSTSLHGKSATTVLIFLKKIIQNYLLIYLASKIKLVRSITMRIVDALR